MQLPAPKRSSSRASKSTPLSLLAAGISLVRLGEPGLESLRCGVMLAGQGSSTGAAGSFLCLHGESVISLGLGTLLLSITISWLLVGSAAPFKLHSLASAPRNGLMSISSCSSSPRVSALHDTGDCGGGAGSILMFICTASTVDDGEASSWSSSTVLSSWSLPLTGREF